MPRKTKYQPPQKADTIINIEGGIHPGRDYIQGDQTNYIYNPQQIANISTPLELAAELQKLRLEIALFKQQPQLETGDRKEMEAVEERINTAEQELQKAEPDGRRVISTLEKAKRTMEALAGSVVAATALGTALAGVIQAAIKVFGG
jgi:hypothetical protein